MRIKGGTQLPRNHTFLAVKTQANLLFQLLWENFPKSVFSPSNKQRRSYKHTSTAPHMLSFPDPGTLSVFFSSVPVRNT